MEESKFNSWEDFTKEEYRRCGTFQLSLEDLARDLYYDDSDNFKKEDSEEKELNFDY
ncbi:MAG: hypothetical protein GY847_22020 [Proteobacteria bacterium]|nr:hypothetical protein [Pseudomonadota bacterium]